MSATIIFGTSQNKVGLYFWNILPIAGLISLWSCGITNFQSRIPELLLSSSKAVNTCEDEKRGQILSVLK